MIGIRVDANSKIATGHMMRCLAIAEALKNMGENVIFIVSDRESSNFLKGQPYSTVILDSTWNILDNEVETLIRIIDQNQITKLFIDSYYVTPYYLNEVNKHVKIAYIDDLNAFYYPCNILINYSVNAEKLNYKKTYPNTKLLLGTEYTPLRKEFRDIPDKKISDNIQSILVMSGGTDKYHFVYRFIKEVFKKESLRKKNYFIICGAFSEDYERICSLTASYSNFEIMRNTSELNIYMEKADLAISAGGISLYELCALGVPTISYLVADNQYSNVTAFDEQKVIKYFGDIRGKIDIKRLVNLIESDEFTAQKRWELSKKMRKLVDGKGSYRIAMELVEK